MRTIHAFVIAIVLLGAGSLTVFSSDENPTACFYLDRNKMDGKLVPIILQRIDDGGARIFLKLDSAGLHHENGKICSWSLNGGSGEKERFSLDGNFAIPILKSDCESPFSHHYTGIGFGDWYLTLCGMENGSYLYVESHGYRYSVSLKALEQWSKYKPGYFPIKGDRGD